MTELKNIKYAFVNNFEYIGILSQKNTIGCVSLLPLPNTEFKKIIAKPKIGFHPLNGCTDVPKLAIADYHEDAFNLWIENSK